MIRFSQKGGNFLLIGTVIADYVKLTSATRENKQFLIRKPACFLKNGYAYLGKAPKQEILETLIL